MRSLILVCAFLAACLAGCSNNRETTIFLDDTKIDLDFVDGEILRIYSLAGFGKDLQILHPEEGKITVKLSKEPSEEQVALLHHLFQNIVLAQQAKNKSEFRVQFSESASERLEQNNLLQDHDQAYPLSYPLRFLSHQGKVIIYRVQQGSMTYHECVYEVRLDTASANVMELLEIEYPVLDLNNSRFITTDAQMEPLLPMIQLVNNGKTVQFVFHIDELPYLAPGSMAATNPDIRNMFDPQTVDYSFCNENVRSTPPGFFGEVLFPHLKSSLKSFSIGEKNS